MDLVISDIHQTYEGLPVLQGVNLSLKMGERVSIVGPSGCGKSTLLRILTGLETPSSGKVFFDKKDITGQKGHFGFMNQSDLLLPWRRLWQNVGLSGEIHRQPKGQIKDRAMAALKEFGLDGFAEYYPHQLSGGMRQRAAFLRTYLTNKELLILDEPFSSVDAITRLELQLWLSSVLDKDKSALILVTHSVEEALLLTSRVIVFTSIPGRIVAIKTVPFFQEPLEEKELDPRFPLLKKEILGLLAPND